MHVMHCAVYKHMAVIGRFIICGSLLCGYLFVDIFEWKIVDTVPLMHLVLPFVHLVSQCMSKLKFLFTKEVYALIICFNRNFDGV